MRTIATALIVFYTLLSAVPSDAAGRRDRPWRIKRVVFTGNQTFRRFELISKMTLRPEFLKKKPRFTKSRLKSDLRSLTSFYQSQGFLSAAAAPLEVSRDSLRKKVSLIISLHEGPRTVISTASLSLLNTDSLLLAKMRCAPGKPFIQASILHDERILRETFAARGYLFTGVTTSVAIDSLKHTANLHFTIKRGPLVVADSAIITGTTRLRPAVIHRELAFKKGDTLTLGRVRTSEKHLYQTNLLNSVLIDPVVHDSSVLAADSSCSTFPIGIAVREANFFRLKIGAGYGTDEKLRGSIETSYNNLFNSGHRLALKGNVSFIMQQIQVIYSTLWFLGIPLRFDGTMYYNRFSNKNTYRGLFRGVRLSLERKNDHNITYQFWTKYEDALWISSQNLPADYPVNNTQSFGIDLLFDTRDNLLDPSKGLYSFLNTELAGITGINSNQFFKISNDMRLFWNIGRVRFAHRLKLGWVRPYGKSTMVPPQDQFYAGGSRSVRGFPDNFLVTFTDTAVHARSGTILGTANLLEMRFPMYRWINGAVFADAGYVWQRLDNAPVESVLRDVRWTAGPGLRITTPIAIIRFDVGFKLDKGPHELLAQWHLDVGQSF